MKQNKTPGEWVTEKLFGYILEIAFASLGFVLLFAGLHDIGVALTVHPTYWDAALILFGFDLTLVPWTRWIQNLPKSRKETEEILEALDKNSV